MKSSSNRHEQAAFWFLRLRDSDVTVEEIDAAMAWLAESSENQTAFDAVEKVWSIEGVPAERSPQSTSPVLRRLNIGRMGKWPMARVLSIAAMVMVMVAIVAGMRTTSFWISQPGLTRYATMVGESRTVTLPDGSLITLGGASSVAVEYESHVRRIVLTDGEALFNVAKNPNRPFIVEAAGGSAQALGTVFNVHRGPEGVTVGVAEGVVQVRAVAASDDAPMVRLHAGSEVSYSALADLGAVKAVSLERVGAWRQGVLTFIDRPLGSVIADLNRYSTRPIVVEDESIKQLHVSGSVAVAGIVEWLRALKDTAAIDLNENDHNLVLDRSTPLETGAPRRQPATSKPPH
ncbi:MAG TPA: FecR domain-containing protein [Spongiibacteraceae bacterium]|nr:FecR domain-containing protein [Spongiibacteraceae bacterium]